MNRNLSLRDYFSEVEAVHKKSPGMRFPQVAFNCLSVEAPDLAKLVIGTHKDPYYVPEENFQNDPRWILFVEFVKENW